jgi:predicted MFS family arabinose efflux permease
MPPLATAPSDLLAAAPIWKRYRAWQRWGFLSILFLVVTSNYFDYFVISVLLEPIKAEFGVSDTLLGLLSGSCFSLAFAVTAIPIARWADCGNRRSVMTFALAAWSVMTITCGFARTFLQLTMARFGVGMAEPGALPPAQSLIMDYFPPERQATATTILVNGASAVGWLVGVGVGGHIAVTHGWRAAFLVAGIPGIALAVLVRFALPEPRSQGIAVQARSPDESLAQTFRQLAKKQSFLFSVVGISVYSTFSFGVLVFIPSFMIRSLHTTLENVSAVWGPAIAIANVVGALIGGWLADHLSRRDLRWYAWLPAAACILGMPFYWLALSSSKVWSFIELEFVGELIFSIGLPVSFVAVLAVSGSRRRAMASAAMVSAETLCGITFGPLLSGALSDFFTSMRGLESLRYSLSLMCLFLIPAAIAFWWAARALRGDQED